MYAEVEPFPLHLCKRKCDRKGEGGAGDGWLLEQDVFKWAFRWDIGCPAIPKRAFSISCGNTYPSIKLPKQQCRETECYPVPFLPLLFTGGLVQSSSSFSFSLFAPPTARLYGNEGSEITAKHSGNGRASGEITTPSPPPTHHLRLVWPNKGALCWREALSLACFCSRPL